MSYFLHFQNIAGGESWTVRSQIPLSVSIGLAVNQLMGRPSQRCWNPPTNLFMRRNATPTHISTQVEHRPTERIACRTEGRSRETAFWEASATWLYNAWPVQVT